MIMWDRKDLKEKGKKAFRANRVTCIFAAFLLSMVTGGFSVPTSTFSEEGQQQLDIPPEVLKIVIAVVGVLAIVAFLLQVFVFNPTQVGLRRFFYRNATDPKAGLDRDTIGRGFVDGNYTNVVAAMFTTELFVALWTLLFIVPGVIKAIAWKMVPYILAENPEMTGTEARQRSAEMMYGSKWKYFVLGLSFFGWIFLGCLTLGIVNILWTNPYMASTDAELYRVLKGEAVSLPAGSEAEKLEEPAVEAVVNDDDDSDVTFVK